jgi:hypothetical protein
MRVSGCSRWRRGGIGESLQAGLAAIEEEKEGHPVLARNFPYWQKMVHRYETKGKTQKSF